MLTFFHPVFGRKLILTLFLFIILPAAGVRGICYSSRLGNFSPQVSSLEKTEMIYASFNHSESIQHKKTLLISTPTILILNNPWLIIVLINIFLIGLFLYLHYRNRKIINAQVDSIRNVIEGIMQKEFDTKIDFGSSDKLNTLTQSLNQMTEHLKEDYKNLEIRVIRRTSEISMRNAELRKKQREILIQNNEIKDAYEALKQSREKYEKLVDHLQYKYIFYSQDPGGNLLFVSPSQKNILGYPTKEFRKNFLQLYTNNPINVEARQNSENSRKGILQKRYLIEILDVNGLAKLFEISEVPIFNEEGELVSVEGLAHDITERQKAEDRIKEQEEKYRMLFTHASDAIFLYELPSEKQKADRIIEANNYALEKLGYTIEELREMSILNLIDTNTLIEDKDRQPEFMFDDQNYERVWVAKNGSMLNFELSSHGFDINNKQMAIAVARDVTERKRAEDEIRFVNEELYNQKENLEALVDNLTQAQEQLVQSEKMAALGQLIAGIAHEINTPLGAIKASVGNLSESLKNALNELPSLLQSQSLDNLKLFTFIFDLSRKEQAKLSSREKRQLRRELANTLKQQKIDKADILADIFIYLNIFKADAELMAALKSDEALNVVRSARNFISLLKNSSTINIAVEKATKVVFALKKYAHRDAEGDKVSTDIIDGIETVLTLYNNQLKQGIEVERNYEKLPLVNCFQDEISQVWTNLIQNAIQAMKHEGTLTITAELEYDEVCVSFKDTGEGIGPDIKDRIFEPFFTTKKQGEGSGMGLDIVKKIIDKHNGTITVESQLGEGATFITKIPLK